MKAHKLRSRTGAVLVFEDADGKPLTHASIVRTGLIPTMVRAGVTVPGEDLDKEGRPITVPKYTGMHALRDFCASWCINRREDGGLGLTAKMVQQRLGHASIVMTMDVYGHLFRVMTGAMNWRLPQQRCWLDATWMRHGTPQAL